MSDNHPLSDKALPGLATGDPLVDQYLRAARAENTHRAYAADLADFRKWGGGGALPATSEQVARYLAWLAQIVANRSEQSGTLDLSKHANILSSHAGHEQGDFA